MNRLLRYFVIWLVTGLPLAAQTPQRATFSKAVVHGPQIGRSQPFLGHITDDLQRLARFSHKRGAAFEVAFHPLYQTPRLLRGKLSEASKSPPAAIAANFLERHREALILDRSVAIKVGKAVRGPLGRTHVTISLEKDGVPFWPASIRVHVDGAGRVIAMNGNYRAPEGLETTPAWGASRAVATAVSEVSPKVSHTTEARLILYDWHVPHPRLAWKVLVRATGLDPLREEVFVDAANGEILNRIDRIATWKAPTTVQVKPSRTSEATAQIAAYRDANINYLIHTGKAMFPGVLDPQTLAGTIFTLDAQQTNASSPVPIATDLDDDGVFDDNANLRAAGAAYYWMSEVYDWLLATFNWNSFDNNGSSLRMFVNFREDPAVGFDNAFWNGSDLIFGDGHQLYFNLAYGADVAAHELCHAITDATAQLVYQFQSGAMNESFSDIYASLFDNDNWLIGENVVQPSFGAPALRSMSDPSQGLAPGANGWQPSHMDEYVNLTAQQDNGGVHVNSGIPNHAFFQLASAIGLADAGQIMHRALTTYLTRNSDFTDLRNAAISSARDLFGNGSNQETAVENAYQAVGIGPAAGDPPQDAGFTLYYPLVSPFQLYGEDYGVGVYISNPNEVTVNGSFEGVGADGASTGTINFSLPAHNSAFVTSEAGDQWIRVVADGKLLGAYQHLNGDGSSWSLIPATPFVNNGMFIPHIATNTQAFWTVGGVANVAETPSSVVYADNVSDDGIVFGELNMFRNGIAFEFESAYQQVFGGMPDSSAAGGLWGLFVNFDFDKSEVLDFNMVGAEIFGRKDAAQSAGLQMDATTGRTIFFTHVAANAAFWTGYSLVNVSDPALGNIPIRISSFDATGTELANTITSLPPFGKLLRVTGDSLVPPGTAWFAASAQREGASLAGMELFGSVDDRQMAGFQALPYTAREFYFPFVVTGAQGRPAVFDGMPENYTGFSIINPNLVTVQLRATLYKFNGETLVAEGSLGPNQKLLDLVSNIFGNNYFGYMKVEADRPVAGFSLSGFTNQQEWAANPMILLE